MVDARTGIDKEPVGKQLRIALYGISQMPLYRKAIAQLPQSQSESVSVLNNYTAFSDSLIRQPENAPHVILTEFNFNANSQWWLMVKKIATLGRAAESQNQPNAPELFIFSDTLDKLTITNYLIPHEMPRNIHLVSLAQFENNPVITLKTAILSTHFRN